MIKWCVILVGVLLTMQGSVHSAFPSDDVIREILKARVDTFQQSVGIVVGLVDSTGSRFISYGNSHIDGTDPVDENTIYEIGSISKVFTSILLADAVYNKELTLRDPAQTYLPADVVLPTSEGRVITLGHLATHRSGLPRMPNNFARGVGSMSDPYPLDRMYAFLNTCTLASDVSEQYLYSNLGFGLLGQILANHAGTDLERLLIKKICEPLGLPDTRYQLSSEQQTRAAGTHDWNDNPTPLINFDAMQGAGSMRSSAADLLRFTAINAGLADSSLWPVLQFAQIDREDAMGRRVDIGLGWHTLYIHGRELVMHSGATFGNMAFAGFDREARRGVVVLSNARGLIDDVGIHLLDPETKLQRFEERSDPPTPIKLEPEKLKAFEGEYAFGPNKVLVVRYEEEKLFGSLNEGLEVEFLTASDSELFSDLAPGTIAFKWDKSGKVVEVIARTFGTETKGEPVEDYQSPAKRAHRDVSGLDRYAGDYEIGDMKVSITQRDDRLYAQSEGQLEMALIPTDTGFYAYEARAMFVFETDDSGQVATVTLHQDGEHRGSRVQDRSLGGEVDR